MITISILLLACLACLLVAWRFNIPAIVLYIVAGVIFGELTGWIDPVETLGHHYHTLISFAVALILFEGGMHLKFSELKHLSKPLKRVFFLNTPLCYIATLFLGHYVAGLSLPVAAIIASLFIITGPTVIIPLLRQARITPRVSSVLKWEGVVNDPVGALLTIFTYEFIVFAERSHNVYAQLGEFLLMIIVVSGVAVMAGYLIKFAFHKGLVPEYLKQKTIITLVILLYALSNMLMEEAGLLAVTVFGMTLANIKLSSSSDIKNFVEHISVMMISIVFVIITATMDFNLILEMDFAAVAFLLMLIFLVRPICVFISMSFSDIQWQDKLLVSWVAPRGIVCAVTAGLIGPKLIDAGYADAKMILPITFSMIIITVVMQGFTAKTLGKKLGLMSKSGGILLVGANKFSIALAKTLQEKEVPVMIADSSWERLREPRMADISVYFGEILSSEVDYSLNLEEYSYLITCTEKPGYNSLVQENYAHLFGRHNIFQVMVENKKDNPRHQYDHTLIANVIAEGQSYSSLNSKIAQGWELTIVGITDEYSYSQFMVDNKDNQFMPILLVDDSWKLSQLPENEIDIVDAKVIFLIKKNEDVATVIENK